MKRYFLEVSYIGKGYSGFQIQKNAPTIQSEVQKVFEILLKEPILFTGSSRTDAGVNANQNYFHFDYYKELKSNFLYSLNSILPQNIAVNGIYQVKQNAHCRFDAISRNYKYYIYSRKNPFLMDRAWYYPYSIDIELLNDYSSVILGLNDFVAFSKLNNQVTSTMCLINSCKWQVQDDYLVLDIEGNRFLRGMVRGLVGTMVKLVRKKASTTVFEQILQSKDIKLVDFSTPAHGLFLNKVIFPTVIFDF